MGANSSASLDLILPRVLAGDSWRGGGRRRGRRAGKVSIFFSLSLMAARSLTLSIQFYNFASTNDKKHHKKSTLKEGGRVELLNATQKSVRAALLARA